MWHERGGLQWLAVAERKRHWQNGVYTACWIELGYVHGEGPAKVDERDFYDDTRSTWKIVRAYVDQLPALE